MQAILSRVHFGLAILAVLALLLSASSLNAATTYTEDFEDDPLGTIAGFDPLFNHLLTGPNGFLSDDIAFPALDQPSLHHELFLGAGLAGVGSTTDFVTFNLPVGSIVTYAGVWMTGTGGGSAGVTFYGTNGSVGFLTSVQDDYDFYDTTGSGIGNIVAIELNLPIYPVAPLNPGPESLYDDIIIKVIPEPSSWLLAAAALVGLAGFAWRRRIAGTV